MTIFSYDAKLSLQIIFLVIRALLPPYCHLPKCLLLLVIRGMGNQLPNQMIFTKIIYTVSRRLSSRNFGPNADWCI